MSEATATSPEPTSGTGTQSSAALSDQRLAPGSDEQVQQQQHDGATDPPPDLSLSDHTPDDTPSPPVHTPPPPVHYPTPQRPAATPEEWRLHIAHLPTASNNTEGLRRDRDNEERQPSHKAPAARPPPPPPRYVVERLGLALTYLPRGMVTTELWGAVAFLSALADEEGGSRKRPRHDDEEEDSDDARRDAKRRRRISDEMWAAWAAYWANARDDEA